MWSIRSLDSCSRGAIFLFHQNSVWLLKHFLDIVYYCCSVWLSVESLNLTLRQECCGKGDGTGILTSPQEDGCRAVHTFSHCMHELVVLAPATAILAIVSLLFEMSIYEHVLCRHSFQHRNSIFNPFLTGKHTDYIGLKIPYRFHTSNFSFLRLHQLSHHRKDVLPSLEKESYRSARRSCRKHAPWEFYRSGIG